MFKGIKNFVSGIFRQKATTKQQTEVIDMSEVVEAVEGKPGFYRHIPSGIEVEGDPHHAAMIGEMMHSNAVGAVGDIRGNKMKVTKLSK